MRVDLHMHTSASDGQLSPTEVVALARKQRLDVISITDHDTTDGIYEAQQAANGLPVVLPGIELSAEDQGEDVHMLGYFIRYDDATFQERLTEFRSLRVGRGEKIVERLETLGKPISWRRVLDIANGASIGRPHVAQAMVEAGYVESISEAFDRYLHTGGPAYVARQRMTPEEAITFIHGAGGVAVMAHPGVLPLYASMVERLARVGLDGVEIIHPQNNYRVRDTLRGLARQYNLLVTGGSDFHRPNFDQMGSFLAPQECVSGLRARAARYRPTAENLTSPP